MRGRLTPALLPLKVSGQPGMPSSDAQSIGQGAELRIEVGGPKWSFPGTKWSDDKAGRGKKATSEKQSGSPGAV